MLELKADWRRLLNSSPFKFECVFLNWSNPTELEYGNVWLRHQTTGGNQVLAWHQCCLTNIGRWTVDVVTILYTKSPTILGYGWMEWLTAYCLKFLILRTFQRCVLVIVSKMIPLRPQHPLDLNDNDVKEAQHAKVPANTRKQTNWSVNVWKEWSDHHWKLIALLNCSLIFSKATMGAQPLIVHRFVLEVRRKDGNEYTPNTLHQLCCGILRYNMREIEPKFNIFKQPRLSDDIGFRNKVIKSVR